MLPLSLLTLKVPRESENTPEQMAQLLASLGRATASPGLISRLLGSKPPVSFSLEVTVIDGQVHFAVVYPTRLADFVRSQILATYPDAVMASSKDYLNTWPHSLPQLGLIRQAYAAFYPLRDYADYKEVDPMLPLLGVLSHAKPEDKVLIQFVLSPPSSSVPAAAYSYLRPSPKLDSNGRPLRDPPPEGKKIVEDKLSYPLVNVSIRFAASRPELIHDLTQAVSVLNRPDGNALVAARLWPWQKLPLWQAIQFRKPLKNIFMPVSTLNVMELSSLWHLPGVYTKIPNVAWAPSSSFSEAPENLPVFAKDNPLNQDINFFATTTYKNQSAIFGIKTPDRLRHFYILGKSGSGKSKLLENMAVDDFKKGRGAAFIDPHGDSAEVLLDYIPASRINDTVYFNPADRECPISLNILQVDHPDQAELVASGIVSIFHKLYGHSWGPRLEYILRNTLLSLTSVPGSTLPNVIKMLTDASFRKKIVPQLTNPQLVSFWKDEYEILDPKVRAEQISSILNKVGQFCNSPLIQQIISHPKSTINLKDILSSGKILIANLSQGKLGEDNAALLGAMLVTQIELAAMARAEIPQSQRQPFFLFVDEFQNFATESFIKILSEARKYGLGLIMANQYIAQLPEPIFKAIFGNAGTILTFVTGSEDARLLSAEFGEKFSPESLVSLQKYQVALKMTIDNMVSLPFLASTLPPLKSSNNNREKVIKVSRQRYALKPTS